MSDDTTLMIDYTNYRGERAWRHIRPQYIQYTSALPYHPKVQWLLHALDVEKNAERDFAMVDIHRTMARSDFLLRDLEAAITKPPAARATLCLVSDCLNEQLKQCTTVPVCPRNQVRCDRNSSPAECACFPGVCRGGEVIAGKLANGLVCKKAKHLLTLLNEKKG